LSTWKKNDIRYVIVGGTAYNLENFVECVVFIHVYGKYGAKYFLLQYD
jgi:hypothetical protein